MTFRDLTEDQVSAFDASANPPAYIMATGYLPRLLPLFHPILSSGVIHALDIGGGTGALADWFLARYPSSSWTVFDSSSRLLAKNIVNVRKTLVCGEAQLPDESLREYRFDLAIMHCILHHLVGTSYKESLDSIASSLRQARSLLRAEGHLSIIEIAYDGWPVDSLASRILYGLTSSRILAPITKRLGANTAGVGVCYLSSRQWSRVLDNAGFRIVRQQELGDWGVKWYVRMVTCLKRIHAVHYWLEVNG